MQLLVNLQSRKGIKKINYVTRTGKHNMTAKSLEKIYRCFKNEPVRLDELETFYVNADNGRARPIKRKLERRLMEADDDNLRFLFADHKGCGKSTDSK